MMGKLPFSEDDVFKCLNVTKMNTEVGCDSLS